MSPHEPDGECGLINQVMTAHVTCVTGPVTINHVSVINCQLITITFNKMFTITAGFNGHSSAVYRNGMQPKILAIIIA